MNSATWSDSQALAYIASYADLRSVYGANPAAGRAHYALAGASEGRSITFDALGYLASYADLRAAYGSNTSAATYHYVVAGASEGRSITFDALGYLASYADLRAAYGSNTSAATYHYVVAGASEGRSITFDPVAHLLSNPDLVAAGYTASDALRHWVSYGANEGRSASGDFGIEQVSHEISLTTSVMGVIDRPGDRDWFEIDLASGEWVNFNFLLSNGNGLVTIHDLTGRTLISSEGKSGGAGFAAPEGGTYYVAVSAANGVTGSYTLTAESKNAEITGDKTTFVSSKSIGLDMFETYIGSAHTPDLTILGPSIARLDYGNNIYNLIEGIGLASEADQSLIGKVVNITEYIDGKLSLTVTNLSLPLADLGEWIVDGAYGEFLKFATAGDNVIYGSDLIDRISSSTGNDIIYAGAGDDYIDGGAGDDVLTGGAGADDIYGGSGFDRAVFSGDRSVNFVSRLSDGQIQVSGPDGIDILSEVEELRFDDGIYQIADIFFATSTLLSPQSERYSSMANSWASADIFHSAEWF